MKKRRNKIRHRRGMQLMTLCISTTMVLVLLGLVVLSVLTARNASNFMRENVEVSVYLSDTLSTEDGVMLRQQVAARPFSKTVVYFTKQQMCQKMANEMGVDPQEAANYMTAEMDIQMVAAYANLDSLKKVSAELMNNPAVVDVSYPKEQIDGMNRILNPVMIGLLGMALLLIFICYTLINNSVHLSIYARRFTIHTMKLVGARWGFIRKPFLKQALTVALISAVLACVVLGGIIYWLYTFEPNAHNIITTRELILTGVSMFVFGFVITMLCTLLSVNRFLRMTAGELYKI